MCRLRPMSDRGPVAVEAAHRFPELAGALNFRDLGGYPAAGGRLTRWRTLYRSGTPHALTTADLEWITAAGIRYSYDLRSTSERLTHPSAFAGVRAVEYRFDDHEGISGDVARMLKLTDARPEHSTSMMMTLYRRLPYDFREAFRCLFLLLERGDLPLVFNCTVGKDRTGVAAALILASLGVPRELIVEDYLLSERCFTRSCEVILHGNLAELFAGVGRAVWEPVMSVNTAYMEAMFEEISRINGSIDAYLANELGVSQAARDRIASHLLEPS